jgi:hypothetical protein
MDEASSSNSMQMAHSWKKIWKIKGPRAVKMFLWKACSNILPTKEKLFERRITNEPLCGLATESVGRIIYSCQSTLDVWLEYNKVI